MPDTAAKWFYNAPEANPYLLQERVNATVWHARLVDVYFIAESTEVPFKMSAEWQGEAITIEWVPGAWFRLIVSGEVVAPLASAFSNILRMPAQLSFTNRDGQIITEWHTDGGETRWREVQGNPTYQSPVRLS